MFCAIVSLGLCFRVNHMENERAKSILDYWFGHVEETIVPSEDRARIWFGENETIDRTIRERFSTDLEQAISGKYSDWEKTARGQLALILVLDQFARHINRGEPTAFNNDNYALKICTRGMEYEFDHNLTLIERVFYYFPLLHSEDLFYQEAAMRSYEALVAFCLPETKVIYESFFKFANHHYNIIRRFGRFPQRNVVLKRESTPEEMQYLKELG